MDADPTMDENSEASGGVDATRRRSAELFTQLRDDTARAERGDGQDGNGNRQAPVEGHGRLLATMAWKSKRDVASRPLDATKAPSS